MSTNVELRDRHVPGAVPAGLQPLGALPAWLEAAAQPERVQSALARRGLKCALGFHYYGVGRGYAAQPFPADAEDLYQDANGGARDVWQPAFVGQESVPLAGARGRVLAQDVRAPVDSPTFDRSAMMASEQNQSRRGGGRGSTFRGGHSRAECEPGR
jgi:hypothetical protein